jgi:hypothetical protein
MSQTRSTGMAVLILAGALFASPSWDATAQRASAGTGLTAAARVWLLELFAKLPAPHSHPTSKACGIDPNGTHCG